MESAILRAYGDSSEREVNTWIYQKKGKSLKIVEGKIVDVIDIKK